MIKKLSMYCFSMLLAGGLLLSAMLAPVPAHAQFNILSVVSQSCRDCGACSLCDLMSVVTKTMRFLLSLSGALGLALFIWGGWTLMLSGGKAEEVEHGKKVVSGTVVGLAIIILLAWVWPTWVIMALKGVPEDKKPPTIFTGGDQWWLTPCQKAEGLARSCDDAGRLSRGTDGVSECTELNSSGVLGFKQKGSDCRGGECPADAECVCDGGGRCIEACRTVSGCTGSQTSLGVQFNYCRKTSASGLGICEKVVPGTPCKSQDECPNLIILSVGSQAVGTSLRQERLQFCNFVTEAADPRCRLVNGQQCDSSDQCAKGESICHLNYCRKICTGSSDCLSSQQCKSGVCI